MGSNKKFRPVISRIRLNPEQAVLSCSCYDNNTHTLPGIRENLFYDFTMPQAFYICDIIHGWTPKGKFMECTGPAAPNGLLSVKAAKSTTTVSS